MPQNTPARKKRVTEVEEVDPNDWSILSPSLRKEIVGKTKENAEKKQKESKPINTKEALEIVSSEGDALKKIFQKGLDVPFERSRTQAQDLKEVKESMTEKIDELTATVSKRFREISAEMDTLDAKLAEMSNSKAVKKRRYSMSSGSSIAEPNCTACSAGYCVVHAEQDDVEE